MLGWKSGIIWYNTMMNLKQKIYRKGIPDSGCSYIWQLFSEKNKYYEKDLFTKLESIPLDEET